MRATADIAVQSVTLERTQPVASTIIARYCVSANTVHEERPVVIDFSQCPLWPVSIKGLTFDPISYGTLQGVAIEPALVELKPFSEWSTKSADIAIELDWSHSQPHRPLIDADFLLLPEELPRIRTDQRFLASPRLLGPHGS